MGWCGGSPGLTARRIGPLLRATGPLQRASGPSSRSSRRASPDGPGLEGAAARRERRLGVRDLRDVAQPGVAEMLQQWCEEPAAGLAAGVVGAAVHPQPGLHERAQEPRPDGALVIGAVALDHPPFVMRPVAGFPRRQRAQAERRQQLPRDGVHDRRGALTLEQGEGQAPDREDLVRAQGGVRRAGDVACVHHIEEAVPLRVPEACAERLAGPPCLSGAGRLAEGGADLQGVHPQRLDLHRLADPRCHHPVAHLGVHPGQLDARHACRQQSVGVAADAEARPPRVSLEDGAHGTSQAVPLVLRHGARPAAGGGQVVVHRHDVPQRRVHAVVLGAVALLHEPVRQHPLRDLRRPGEQDVAGLIEPAVGDAEAAQGDEGVAAPVREPRVAGDDRSDPRRGARGRHRRHGRAGRGRRVGVPPPRRGAAAPVRSHPGSPPRSCRRPCRPPRAAAPPRRDRGRS